LPSTSIWVFSTNKMQRVGVEKMQEQLVVQFREDH
jgi:hypothetical protein